MLGNSRQCQVTAIMVGILGMSIPAAAATTMNATLEMDATVRAGTHADEVQSVSDQLAAFYHKDNSSNSKRLSYIRFDASTLPANAVVTGVSLNLYMPSHVDNDTPVLLYGLKDGVAGETNFDRATMTFESRPDYNAGNGGEDGAPNDDTTGLLGSLTVHHDDARTISFTNANVNGGSDLLSFINADTNHKLVFILGTADDSGVAYFSSASNTKGNPVPQLELTYDVMPEPASFAMLALGGMGLLLKRRRS